MLAGAVAGAGAETGTAAGAGDVGGGFTGTFDLAGALEALVSFPVALRTAATNGSPPCGVGMAPVRMLLNGTILPYSSRVASSSCVTDEPFTVTPANNPRARE